MLKNRFIIILMACLCLLTACQKEEVSLDEPILDEELLTPEQVNYDITLVEKGNYVKNSQGSAALEFPIWADLSCETSDTRLKEIFVKKGDSVKKGDILVTFERKADTIALEELELQLKRKKESLEADKADRMEEITIAEEALEEIYTHQELRIAVLNIEKKRISYEKMVYQTEKSIKDLEERIEELKEDLENNKLIAPFDGVIEKVVSFHAGSLLEKGETILSMYSPEIMLFKVKSANGKLRYNMDVTVTAGRKNQIKSYAGKVVTASNILPYTISKDYALIKLNVDAPESDFNSNIKFSGTFQEIRNVLLVDRNAIEKEDNKSFVYILENDIISKRYISEGYDNREQVWVLDGLYEGQSLILN